MMSGSWPGNTCLFLMQAFLEQLVGIQVPGARGLELNGQHRDLGFISGAGR